ncbi:MAG: UDP-N-acetylglucosamine pyrophosphorylase [Thermoleophilia bacterium]|jgi:NDP-sugar pyrophosphorylase family protein
MLDLPPCNNRQVDCLLEKGVVIPHPESVYVGGEVDPERISGTGVTIYPGCRIYGAKTVLSAGVKLGAEGPATVDDCRLGPRVELKGGYFRSSVFLEKANMGLGAQVREACLLEEEANGGHCVGLKQTILMPFVTLGSLINFCDCLMAGGTSRKDHSEVGSSYIHFNYTPDGDKTTPSLFGDVPRGVMLDRPAIFLGGQGGAVGPVRVGFGTVVAAGSVLRRDVLQDGQLVSVAPPPGLVRERRVHAYGNLARVLRNNFLYLANLAALEVWYTKIRRPFFARQELGLLIYEGALEMFSLAKEERSRRLAAMAEKVPLSALQGTDLREHVGSACAVFDQAIETAKGEEFQDVFWRAVGEPDDYLKAVQSLPPKASRLGVEWLQQIVAESMRRVDRLLPSFELLNDSR